MAILRLAMETWAIDFAKLLSENIRKFILQNGNCNVMLTGGRSATRFYQVWSQLPEFRLMSDVTFYFGDERCVPRDHPDSNYGLAMRHLFHAGIPGDCKVIPMPGDAIKLDVAISEYEDLLLKPMDILLLSVGDDGHIASLFPGSLSLHEIKRRVLHVRGNEAPFDRLTITRKVIENARIIYVMACGNEKRKILIKLTENPDDYLSIPARLVMHGDWITDNGHFKNISY